MRYYTVAEIDVTETAWVREYVLGTSPLVEAAGGRYLARTGDVALVEGHGAAPQTVVIIEWPSKEAAELFYASDAYRPFQAMRAAGSRGRFLLAAGEDVTGIASVGPADQA